MNINGKHGVGLINPVDSEGYPGGRGVPVHIHIMPNKLLTENPVTP